MKKNVVCAATLAAFAPASLMAQALAPGQGPAALLYYELPLGVAHTKEAQAASACASSAATPTGPN